LKPRNIAVTIILLAVLVLKGFCVQTVCAQDKPADEPAATEPAATEAEPATEAAPVEKKEAPRVTLWQLLTQGGSVGIVILLCSAVAVGIILKLSFSLRKTKLMPEETVASIGDMLKAKRVNDAVNYCKENDGIMTRILAAGLEKRNQGIAEMEEAMSTVTEEENASIHQTVNWLNVIGSISPMLGLLGTVLGMVRAFNKIAVYGNPTAKDLAGDIQFALVTTVLGLIVAIPCLAAYSIFRNMATKGMMEIGTRINGFMEIVLGKAAARPAAAAVPPPRPAAPPAQPGAVPPPPPQT